MTKTPPPSPRSPRSAAQTSSTTPPKTPATPGKRSDAQSVRAMLDEVRSGALKDTGREPIELEKFRVEAKIALKLKDWGAVAIKKSAVEDENLRRICEKLARGAVAAAEKLAKKPGRESDVKELLSLHGFFAQFSKRDLTNAAVADDLKRTKQLSGRSIDFSEAQQLLTHFKKGAQQWVTDKSHLLDDSYELPDKA